MDSPPPQKNECAISQDIRIKRGYEVLKGDFFVQTQAPVDLQLIMEETQLIRLYLERKQAQTVALAADNELPVHCRSFCVRI